MYDDGYENMYNMDISEVVIAQIKERNEQREKMAWETMDIRNMSYEDDFFDIAIDKSTIDALLCGNDAFLNVAKMTKEVSRVLKPGGCYFVISYGKPANRNLHFQREHLDFEISEFVLFPSTAESEQEKLDKSHFVYACKKGPSANEKLGGWEAVEKSLIREIRVEEDKYQQIQQFKSAIERLEDEESEEKEEGENNHDKEKVEL